MHVVRVGDAGAVIHRIMIEQYVRKGAADRVGGVAGEGRQAAAAGQSIADQGDMPDPRLDGSLRVDHVRPVPM